MKHFRNLFQSALIFSVCICVFPACTITGNGEINHEVLKEYEGFLQIPGVGWQTFYRTAPEDKTIENLPFKSGSAYVRWTWGQLEPEEGQYAFAMIDDWLDRCRQANQALAFRVMLSNPGGRDVLPQWLLNKGVKTIWSECEGEHYMVDLEEPLVKYHHQKLIRALGQRYDGHPDLALVDIGSVGLWGEWHYYCDQTPGLMPGDAERKAVIDLYYDAFPNTPLTSLVDDKPNVLYANSRGRSAWRGDCWGNGRGPDGSWNHHEHSYKPMVELMPDGWKVGTVALEPCGIFGRYASSAKEAAEAAIAWHATFIQNKSNAIPPEWLPEIERLVMKLGFRLTLRELYFSHYNIRAGETLKMHMKWENLGIAPPYRDHRIALRLRDGNDHYVAGKITEISVMGWLPGEKEVTVKYPLPGDIATEKYAIEMGIVFHNSPGHIVPIANYGKTADGWYKLGDVKIIR
jgi:hypothetical protein